MDISECQILSQELEPIVRRLREALAGQTGQPESLVRHFACLLPPGRRFLESTVAELFDELDVRNRHISIGGMLLRMQQQGVLQVEVVYSSARGASVAYSLHPAHRPPAAPRQAE